MFLRLLQFRLLDYLMFQPVALQLVVFELKVLVAPALKSLVLALLLRQFRVLALLLRQSRVLVLQFQ